MPIRIEFDCSKSGYCIGYIDHNILIPKLYYSNIKKEYFLLCDNQIKKDYRYDLIRWSKYDLYLIGKYTNFDITKKCICRYCKIQNLDIVCYFCKERSK